MGLIILGLFLIYIIVVYLLSIFIFKIFKRKLISRLFLSFCLIFPFWDILLQNTTALYYSSLNPNFKVFHQAELDKNGKVESIAYLEGTRASNYYTPTQLNKYYTKEFNMVSDFLEFLVKDEEGKEKILKIKKLSQGNYKFELNEKSQARYKVYIEEVTVSFYYKHGYKKILDTKENKLMAESYYLYFKEFSEYFRTKVLYMVTGVGTSAFREPNETSYNSEFLLEEIGIKDKK